jgi:NDP-sugar pyrophosphorylase family protein
VRAVVICCNFGWIPEALLKRRPFCLMPAGRTPLAQIVLERLLSQGVRRITFAVSDEADFVQGHFGSGERWGAAIDYVLLKSFTGIGETLRRLPGDRGRDVLVIPGMLLAESGVAALAAARGRGATAAVAVFHGPGIGRTGGEAGEMALLSPEALAKLPPKLTRLSPEIIKWAEAGEAEVINDPGPALWVDDFAGYWRAHQAALAGQSPFAPCKGRDVRIGLRCRIDSQAVFSPPVIVGDEVEIGRGCRVGPGAVIGDGCILDVGVEASDCLALAGTYLGPETSLISAVADQGLLVRYPDGTATHVPDFFIMGPVSAMTSGRGSSKILQRAIALALLCVAWPLVLALRLAGTVFPGTWKKERFAGRARLEALSGEIGLTEVEVRLFASGNALLRHLPTLYDAARGEVDLIGVELISLEQARGLIGTWAESRLFCRPGLIHPWTGLYGGDPDDMEKRVMEVYYANTRSLGADMKILWSVVTGLGRFLLKPKIAD